MLSICVVTMFVLVAGNFTSAPSGVSAQGTWESIAATQENQWRAVAYGNGVFVAVSADGTNRVMRSTDGGTTWEARTASEANQWQSVTYGSGVFVAVAATGTNQVMRSTDGGLTWTSHAPADTANLTSWRSVTYGNGVFVAVAESGTNRVMRSTDGGVTWTRETSADESIQWYSVTYGNGVFVAVSDNGTGRVMRSTDGGVTWTKHTAAKSNGWYSVTYGNGVFVAVSYSGTNDRVMTSTDGETWISRTSAANNTWVSVTYGNGIFRAVAWGINSVMKSTDGVNWTTETSTVSASWNSIAYGEGVFVAVADTSTPRVKRLDSRTVPTKPTATNLRCVNAITYLDVAVSSDGGSPITNFEYHIATSHPTSAPTTWQAFSPAQTTSPLQWNMSALGYTPGVQHHYFVRAVNAMGESVSSWISNFQSSCANSFTIPPPPAPTIAFVGELGNNNITSDITPMVSITGALDGHTVTVTATKDGQSITCTFIATAESSCNLGALADGVWQVTATQTSSAGRTSVASAPVSLTVDTTPPTVVSAEMNTAGTQLTITFNEELGTTAPAIGDFLLTVDGAIVEVTAISVSGSTVVLTLATPATAGQVVGVAYTAPASNTASSNAAVQDRIGNDALSFTINAKVPASPPTGSGSTSQGSAAADSASSKPSASSNVATPPLPATGMDILPMVLSLLLVISGTTLSAIARRRRVIG